MAIKLFHLISKVLKNKFESYNKTLKGEVLLSLSIMMVCFLSTVNYGLFKVLKDTLILAIPGGKGKILLSVLKIWAIIPASILFAAAIIQINRFMSLRQVFYVLSIFYLIFTISFGLFYSKIEVLYLHSLYNYTESTLSGTLAGNLLLPVVKLIEFWPITLFYVMSEMWNTNLYLLVFWGILNAEFSPSRAKGLYPLLNLVGNSAGMFIAPLFSIVASIFTSWDAQMFVFLSIASACIVLICGFFYLSMIYIDKQGKKLSENKTSQMKDHVGSSSKKMKVSLLSGIKKILKDPYLLTLAFTMIGYNLVLNLTELVWKGMLFDVLQDKTLIANQLSLLTSHIAIASTVIGVMLPFMLPVLGLRLTGGIYPLVSMIPLGIFAFKAIKFFWLPGIVVDLKYLWIGHFGLVLLRSGKYTIYDTIKDICLNILDPATMIEAKSSIDAVISRLGKGMSSVYYSTASAVTSEATASMLSEGLVIVVGVAWIASLFNLGLLYNNKKST